MQLNQFPSIKRQRPIRMLVVSLSLTILFALVISAARRQGSREVRQVRLRVEDSRPVSKAILRLEEKYKWVITYEDPRYIHHSEVTDVTLKVRKDLDKYKPGEAPKVLIPIKRVLEFTYDVAPSSSLSPDPTMVVQRLLDAQAASGTGGRFRMESRGKIVHVIPTAIKNKDGVIVPQKSILDTVVSLPATERNVYDKLKSICNAVAQANGIRRMGIGSYPTMFHQFRDREGVVSQKARDILTDTFAKIQDGDGLSWRLYYDPGWEGYLLHVYHIALLDGKE